jgi:outer membrane cobalamin receptor
MLSWSRPRVASVSFLGSYAGERPDMDFNQFPAARVTLPSYVKLDLAGSYSLIRTGSKKSGIDITVRVDNALDRKYEDVFGYPAPKRTWLVGARIEVAM